MKKIVQTLLTVMVMATAASAQTDKGDWMVGGSMTIQTQTNNSQFAFQPSGGYFFAKNFVAGANVTLDFGKTGDTKTSSILAGPFARYYFSLKNPTFKPMVLAEYGIGNYVTKFSDIKNSNTYSNFLLGAGGAFFINSNVALEAVAGYTHGKVQGQSPENGFLFRIGFQVHLLGGEVDRVRGK